MDSVGVVENGQLMREELADNDLLKRDLKKLAGYVTPYVPMIGLVCDGLVVAKHWYTKLEKIEEEEEEEEEED